MSYLDDVKFQYYPANIKIVRPLGELSLREFIRAIKNPQEKIKNLFKEIKKASADGDTSLKAKLKKQLFYFTPCVNTDGEGRAYKNVNSWTGLVQFDVDGILNPEEFRDWFFENCKSCVVSGVSSSGLGVKGLIRIPKVNSVEEYKSYFYGISHYMEKCKGWDTAPKNSCLPFFLFNDENLKFRENPSIWTTKGYQEDAFDMNSVDLDFESSEELDREGLEGIARHIKNTIGRADIEQIGHKNVVSSSLLAGGYASMYLNIDEDKMLEYLITLIEESKYLQKDMNNYKKTANTMFNKGLLSPISYKKN